MLGKIAGHGRLRRQRRTPPFGLWLAAVALVQRRGFGFGASPRGTGRPATAAICRCAPAALLVAGFLAVTAPALANAAEADLERSCVRYASAGVRVAECAAQLRLARDSTAKYRDPAVALRDGFVKTDDCEDAAHQGEDPALGAMGEHWVRFDRMADERLDPREPEILLYVDTPSGRRLVGVEWSFQRVERGLPVVGGLPYYGTQPPDPSRTTPPPQMFGGRAFDGPMQGHHVHQPWHYDLHVWLWEENPAGIFAHYNQRVSCRHGVAPEAADASRTGSPRHRLRLNVTPRRVRAGTRTRFRFRTAAGRTAVSGASIRFAGRAVRTGRGGRATLVKRLSRPGRYRVIATKPNFVRATAAVRVVR